MTDVRPVAWARAIRDAVPRFTATRQHVLICLALRMRPNGTGFASAKTLGEDARCGEQTARRATDDARARGYLNRTRRGHRRGDGTAVASEWELLLSPDAEPQPVTDDRLSAASSGPGVPVENSSTGHGVPVEDRLNRSEGPLNRSPVTTQEVSTRGNAAAARWPYIVGATDEEMVVIVADLRRTRGDLSDGLLRHILREDGPVLLEKLRAERGRADVAEWLAWADTQRQCHPEHQIPGGDLIRPDTGKLRCPMCQRQAERAA